MNRTQYSGLIIVSVIALAAARPAAAQVQLSNVTNLPAIGGAIGAPSNADETVRHRVGPDVSALFELPVANTWSVRAEVSRSSWLDKREALPNAPLHDTVALSRITVGAIHKVPLDPITAYVGGGVGLYHYGSEASSGIHGVVGLQIPSDTRFGVATELQLHVVGPGPTREPLLVLSPSIGMRMRF